MEDISFDVTILCRRQRRNDTLTREVQENINRLEAQVEAAIDSMERFDLSGSIAAAMTIVRRVDAFINETAPFKLAKDPEMAAQVGDILYRCAEAIRIASCLLEATMPEKILELRDAWNLGAPTGDLRGECQWGRLAAGTAIEKVALFPRVESE